MRGPAPKDPALRQRRNKASTRATLKAMPIHRMPSLPKRSEDQEWHPLTRAWWRDIWHSPMAAEYLKADIHGLYRLAVLIQRFWEKPTVNLSAVIAIQEQRYGLTPLDRRRLEWIVEKAEERTRKHDVKRPPKGAGDPRELLRLVQ